jgi:Winged helix DNA-binding domain
VIAERLTAQQLSGPPARTPLAVAQRLLAVQAQDPRGARLAVRSRSGGLRATDIDDALNARALLVTWLNRGTLHLVAADDYWWLHPLTTPQLAVANRRRLGQEGVSAAQAERGVEVVLDAVSRGPQTRAELRRGLDDAGVPTARQALVHVLFAASIEGAIVRGPMRGPQQAFVAVSDWLGKPPTRLDRSDALAMLARRYLAGHGPADARDLAKWAGITLGDARLGLVAIDAELTKADGLVDLADRRAPAILPGPRLLGPFDPLLLGWVSREPIVGTKPVATTNGIVRPVALVDGRVVATWGLAASTLTITLLEKIAAPDVDALRADAADVFRFLETSEPCTVVVNASARIAGS